MKHSILAILLLSAACVRAAEPAAAADKTPQAPLPGHSNHGDSFNEGPRQAAYLMKGIGKVDFPVTTADEEAQKFFNQGVGQLHGFWYFEAERSFRQVAKLDPACAMAYWGMAMANTNNAARAKEFIKKAVELKENASHHEALWIDALAEYHRENKQDEKRDEQARRRDYVRNLEKIVQEYPKDIEAKAFLAMQIWENSYKNMPITSHQAVETLIAEVLNADKNHPAHHYRIHLWDEEKAERALVSAAQCGQASPGIAHMWHMPGHTFVKLDRFADAAWQQEASIRVDNAQLIRDRVLPDQIHNYAHNAEWLIRDLSHVGRVRDGIDLAKNLIELPRHPKYNNLGAEDDKGVYNPPHNNAYFGRARLFEMLERFELWDELIAECGGTYLAPLGIADEDARRLRVLARAWLAKGDLDKGRAQIAALEEMLKTAREKKQTAAEKAEAKAKTDKLEEDKIKKAVEEASAGFTKRVEFLEKMLPELKGYESLADGKIDAAKEFFAKAENLYKPRQALIWLALNDNAKAEQLAREAVNENKKQVQPLANGADVLYRCGKVEEAEKFFNQLRELSAYLDIDMPVFQRLKPLAEHLGLATDWRIAPQKQADSGKRPELKTLGPFKWHAAPAPEFSLTDSAGRTVALKDYRGKPVLLIFYLGYKCSHCMEQLDLLLPMSSEFNAAGISVVAISSDGTADLSKTSGRVKEGATYTLLSDSHLKTFKAYRAYDDFENIPLHGTFLVDGNGDVRWQDVSFQPFKEGKFLLDECKRLLQQTAPPSGEPHRVAKN